jgi:hypothetical protein
MQGLTIPPKIGHFTKSGMLILVIQSNAHLLIHMGFEGRY